MIEDQRRTRNNLIIIGSAFLGAFVLALLMFWALEVPASSITRAVSVALLVGAVGSFAGAARAKRDADAGDGQPGVGRPGVSQPGAVQPGPVPAQQASAPPGHPQQGYPPAGLSPPGHVQPYAAGPRRAHSASSMLAGLLGLLTAGLVAWFAVANMQMYDAPASWPGVIRSNVIGGFCTAGLLAIAAGFTLARKVAGAWTLCAISLFLSMMNIVLTPLLLGVSFDDQLDFVFGFDKTTSVAIGLTTIAGALTAIAAVAAVATVAKKSRDRPAESWPHPVRGQP